MAIYYARANGNVNGAIWATTPTGTAGSYYPFTASDELVANSFAVTINVNLTAAVIRNETTPGLAGGSFYINDNITLNVPTLSFYASTSLNCGDNVTINGNLFCNTGGTVTILTLVNRLTINGNVQGGVGGLSIAIILNGVNAELTLNNSLVLGQSTGNAIINTVGTINANGVTARGTSTGSAISSASTLNMTNCTIGSGGLAVTNGTATVSGTINPTTTTTTAVTVSNGTLNFTGSVIPASSTGITITGGTTTVNGNIYPTGFYGILFNSGTASLTVNGNVSGGTTGGTNSGIIVAGGNPTIVINGNITGGTGSSNLNNTGITINSIANVTVNGNVTGSAGAAGVYSSVNSSLTVNGTATGGANYAGILNASIGSATVTRAKGNAFGSGVSGVTAQPGVSNSSTGICIVSELEYGDLGQSPTSGVITFPNSTANKAIVYKGGGIKKTLIDAATSATLVPANSDVRSGVSYNLGNNTGTCVIPAANTVVAGTPVDATVGTAVISAATVLDDLTSNTRVSGSYGERLKNVATVASTQQQLSELL